MQNLKIFCNISCRCATLKQICLPLWASLGSSCRYWPVWPAPYSPSPGLWLVCRSPWRRSSPCPWFDSLSLVQRFAGCCHLAWSRGSQPAASAACSPSPEAFCLSLAGSFPAPEPCSREEWISWTVFAWNTIWGNYFWSKWPEHIRFTRSGQALSEEEKNPCSSHL